MRLRTLEVYKLYIGERDTIALEARGFFARLWGSGGHSTKISQFHNSMTALERDMKVYRLQINIQKFNPVIPLIELIVGIISAFVSVLVLLNL